MADSYPLGGIPSLNASEGETLTFNVTSSLGERTKFEKRATPGPKGKMAIDEKTGVFTYTPAAEDKDEIAVWIRARKGAKVEKQRVFITPHPKLPSEFNCIEHVSEKAPVKDSRFYMTFVEQNAEELYFNREGLLTDKKVMTKKLMVSGVTLVIERNNDEGSLYKKLAGRADLKELTLCADEVIIGCDLKLPGTDVNIYARRLVFKDAGGEIGRITTTPNPITAVTPTPQSGPPKYGEYLVGLDGQQGGNVRLYVGELETPGTAKRINTTGGTGQEGYPGIPGVDGEDLTGPQRWSLKFRVENTDFDYTKGIVLTNVPAGDQGALIGAKVYVQYKDGWGKVVDNKTFEFGRFPNSHITYKAHPGRAGRGGDGGSIYTQFKDQLANRVSFDAGEAGKRAAQHPAAKPAKPNPSFMARIECERDRSAPVRILKQTIEKVQNFDPPVGAAGLNPIRPAPKPGQIQPLTGPTFWGHPAAVRAIVAYANDAFLTGHAEDARELLVLYRDAIAAYLKPGLTKFGPAKTAFTEVEDKFEAAKINLETAKKKRDPNLAAIQAEYNTAQSNYDTALTKLMADAPEVDRTWLGLQAELVALIGRIDGPYDYFGNPAGWVPMLSFQANHQLYVSELESAIKIMFLAYWIENNQTRRAEKAEVIKQALEKLRDEIKKAVDDYNAANKQLSSLDGQVANIKAKIESMSKTLLEIEKTEREKVKGDLEREALLRSAAKIVGGVMQLIPVGQPVLGAIGKTAVAIGEIDLDNPKGIAGQIGGAWSEVAKEKLVPKVSKFFEDLKGVKEEEEEEDKEKEEFEKELAKKKREAKVKAHLDDQKEAKETVIKAFSSFAVSEDDIKKRLKQALAQCKEYQKMAADIEELNKLKAACAENLLAALQAIDGATTTVLKNQLALRTLRAQLGATLEKLNLEALQYVRGLGQRARDRLLSYQYYLVKSYHYLMLDELPEIDFRAQKMFDSFVKMMDPGTKQEVNLLELSPNGALTPEQFDLLKAVFDAQLREITQKIVAYYSSHDTRVKGEQTLDLKDQLETLNGPAQSVDIDLLWLLDRQREDVRLTKIEINSIKLADPLPQSAEDLSLEYLHDGLSRVRRGGRLFLFRSGEYRVAAGSKGQSKVSDKITWNTDVSYDPDHEKPLSWKESKHDPEAESLISYLIGSNDKGQSKMLSFRPSAWTRLTVSRSGNYGGKIESLKLKLHYVYYPVDKKLSTVIVKVADDAQPLIRCNPLDENQRGDGQGTFVRTFDKKTVDHVTLRAPKRYGGRAFQGWKKGGNSAEGLPGEPTALELKMSESPNFLIEALYAPTQYVPVNALGEEWPACPAGWDFDDWRFENASNSHVLISRISEHVGSGPHYTPTINEPQGSNDVKLSFDKLSLPPTHSARISVCIRPGAEAQFNLGHIGFIWNDLFSIYFDQAGRFAGVKKKGGKLWMPADGHFFIDREERFITFHG